MAHLTDLVMVTFKAPHDDKERWKQEALNRKISLGELIRIRMDDLPLTPATASMTIVQAARPKPKRKKLLCEHRLPPGTWCKACEQIRQ